MYVKKMKIKFLERLKISINQNHDKIAIKFVNQLTYKEMEQKIIQIGTYLTQTLEHNKNNRIAVLFSDKSKAIISMLAILRVGGTYVPIDINLPEKRRRLIFSDSLCSIVITDLIFPNHECTQTYQVINYDTILENIKFDINNDCFPCIKNNDVMYIIYTSGSTGIPKGVEVRYDAICNHVDYYTDLMNITSHDRIIQFANLSFDASISEILMTILNGASLHIPDQQIIYNFRLFENFLNQEQITIATLPPSYLSNLQPTKISALRSIITAGSSTNHALVKKWNNHVLYINGYGPTETTICATTYVAETTSQLELYKSIPIGRPIPNYNAYLATENGAIHRYPNIPYNVIGELYIGGLGVAKGYLNKEQLNKEKFISIQGDRVYKTGDIVYLNDYNYFEFLGRNDDQVKIRGNRIILEDVKNNIMQHDEILDCHVMTLNSNNHEITLCAYLVSKVNSKITKQDLVKFLLNLIPSYMIPNHIVFLKKLPLNDNGKVNKDVLPNPLLTTKENSLENYLYKCGTSHEILQIFNMVLGNNISPNDTISNFGIDSIKIAQIISEIYERFKVDISFQNFYKIKTVSDCIDFILDNNTINYPTFSISPVQKYYTLSSQQKRLFYLQEKIPESTAYNLPLVLKSPKSLNKTHIKTLNKAISKLVSKYELLRSTFDIVDNEVVRIVHNKTSIHLDIININSFDFPQNLITFLDKIIKPFKLSIFPLIKFSFVSFSNNENYLIIDMHHIIADWHSINLLIKELNNIIKGKIDRTCSKIDYDYKDYVDWQKTLLSSNHYNKYGQFWQKEFDAPLVRLNVPSDNSKDISLVKNKKTIIKKLDLKLINNIKKFSINNNFSEFTIFLSNLFILLSKYSGENDITIGCPVHNRTNKNMQDIFGMFVNTIPIRISIQDDLVLQNFVSKVHDKVLNALDNQNYQLEDILEVTSLMSEDSSNTIFDTILVMQPSIMEQIKLQDITLTKVNYSPKHSICSLLIEIEPTENNLLLKLHYETSLFNKYRANQFIKLFLRLLNNFCNSKAHNTKIKDIELVDTLEKKQIVLQWNKTYKQFNKNIDWFSLFTNNVLKTPNNTAILYQDKHTSYKALDDMASIIASKLYLLGIRKGDILLFFMDRSESMIAAYVAALKLGIIFVPVDIDQIGPRVQNILLQIKPKAVLSHQKYKNIFDEIQNIIILDIDTVLKETEYFTIPKYSYHNSDIAYIIFTSGTTGVPKGVVIKHSSVLNLIDWCFNKFHFNKDDIGLFVTSVGFDLSIFDILGMLSCGGTIYLTNDEERKNPKILADILYTQNISFWNSTPQLLASVIPFLQLQPNEEIPNKNFRLAFLSGDYIPLDLPKQITNYFKKSKVISLGGATEGTVWSNYYIIDRIRKKWQSIPYGKPIQNCQYYILDKNMNVCPIGVVGELYISGECLALEYWNDKQKTAEKFIKSPFTTSKYMYRTGDLARFMQDGNIELFGRIDNQVKIRGFRVEICEIELAIKKHEAVKNVFVFYSRSDDRKDSILVAFVTIQKDYTNSNIIEALKQFTNSLLPQYMVPNLFILVDQIPITSNGKPNVKKLQELIDVKQISQSVVPPINAAEELVYNICTQLLQTKLIDLDKSFFDNGGNSLKSMSFYAILHKYFELTFNDIFKYHSLRILANNIKFNPKILENKIDYINKLISNPIAKCSCIANHSECIDLAALNQYKNILITGISGYLGIHILKNLLAMDATFYLLIRAENLEEAVNRFKSHLFYYSLENINQYIGNKIQILCGNLSDQKFTLSDITYNYLVANIDCVVNAAAYTSHYGEKQTFIVNNINTVKNIIQFCLKGNKHLHHISTTSIVYSQSYSGYCHFDENTPICNKENNFKESNYYVESKKIAESLIEKARIEQKLIANIYRVGNIVFSSKNSQLPHNYSTNAFCLLMSNFLKSKCLPNHPNIKFELTPVDQLSEAFYTLFLRSKLNNKNFHLFNKNLYQINYLYQAISLLDNKINFLQLQDYKSFLINKYNSGNIESVSSILLNFYGSSQPIVFKINVLSEFTDIVLKECGFYWNKLSLEIITNFFINLIKGINNGSQK